MKKDPVRVELNKQDRLKKIRKNFKKKKGLK